MRLIISIFLISIVSVFGEEEVKHVRTFHYPPYLLQVLKTKYEGATLKELLSNAGANLDDKDIVAGPNGAGIIVRSSINNLETIEEIIKSCYPLQSAFQNSKDIKKTLISNKWDLSNLGIGIVNFKTKNSAVVTTRNVYDNPFSEDDDPFLGDSTANKNNVYIEKTNYRWVLTKQNVIEFRSDMGKMLFTAILIGDKLHIQDFHSKPSIEITISSIKEPNQNKKENNNQESDSK